MYKQKINLAELKRQAESAGDIAIKSCSRSRCYITDGREIMIATTEGVARIPIEQAKLFCQEFTNTMTVAAGLLKELTIDDKNKTAREKGMSYGQLHAIIAGLGDIKNEKL